MALPAAAAAAGVQSEAASCLLFMAVLVIKAGVLMQGVAYKSK